ncbi:alpha/beta hydrolase [Chlorogloeopsis sp. ULAP02]|uniref:alpha/beta fold hydrolase n=1 Tax=Chlorogloeopsis sp. ULAP02 TaxID=3107926 RepID=UPI0031349B22
MLHGYTDSWFSYSRVLPSLSSVYHTYALDQRGHGDSERPSSGYDIPDFAADMVAFMDVMRLTQTTLVGHSMGSLVAQQVALSAPERVARLILVGSATNMRSKDVFQLQQAVNALDDPVPPEFAREFQLSTIYHSVPDNFLDRAVAQTLKLPARVWRAALAGQLAVDYTAQINCIQMPTLVLRGDHDTIFSQSAQDALVVGLANAVLKVYPETGHALHWERPDEFVHDIEAFIIRTKSP